MTPSIAHIGRKIRVREGQKEKEYVVVSLRRAGGGLRAWMQADGHPEQKSMPIDNETTCWARQKAESEAERKRNLSRCKSESQWQCEACWALVPKRFSSCECGQYKDLTTMRACNCFHPTLSGRIKRDDVERLAKAKVKFLRLNPDCTTDGLFFSSPEHESVRASTNERLESISDDHLQDSGIKRDIAESALKRKRCPAVQWWVVGEPQQVGASQATSNWESSLSDQGSEPIPEDSNSPVASPDARPTKYPPLEDSDSEPELSQVRKTRRRIFAPVCISSPEPIANSSEHEVSEKLGKVRFSRRERRTPAALKEYDLTQNRASTRVSAGLKESSDILQAEDVDLQEERTQSSNPTSTSSHEESPEDSSKQSNLPENFQQSRPTREETKGPCLNFHGGLSKPAAVKLDSEVEVGLIRHQESAVEDVEAAMDGEGPDTPGPDSEGGRPNCEVDMPKVDSNDKASSVLDQETANITNKDGVPLFHCPEKLSAQALPLSTEPCQSDHCQAETTLFPTTRGYNHGKPIRSLAPLFSEAKQDEVCSAAPERGELAAVEETISKLLDFADMAASPPRETPTDVPKHFYDGAGQHILGQGDHTAFDTMKSHTCMAEEDCPSPHDMLNRELNAPFSLDPFEVHAKQPLAARMSRGARLAGLASEKRSGTMGADGKEPMSPVWNNNLRVTLKMPKQRLTDFSTQKLGCETGLTGMMRSPSQRAEPLNESSPTSPPNGTIQNSPPQDYCTPALDRSQKVAPRGILKPSSPQAELSDPNLEPSTPPLIEELVSEFAAIRDIIQQKPELSGREEFKEIIERLKNAEAKAKSDRISKKVRKSVTFAEGEALKAVRII